tara:strand:+ start:1865 stop:2182 length:318 start_codon:yes stop_codon:yes gene_type:complete
MTEIKTGYPTVFGGDVVIANPATKEKGKAIDAEASKLPNKEKEAFLGTVLAKMWGEIEIIAVADDCTRFKAGDIALGTPESMKGATVTPDGEYLIVNERTFKGKW